MCGEYGDGREVKYFCDCSVPFHGPQVFDTCGIHRKNNTPLEANRSKVQQMDDPEINKERAEINDLLSEVKRVCIRGVDFIQITPEITAQEWFDQSVPTLKIFKDGEQLYFYKGESLVFDRPILSRENKEYLLYLACLT